MKNVDYLITFIKSSKYIWWQKKIQVNDIIILLEYTGARFTVYILVLENKKEIKKENSTFNCWDGKI